MYRMDQDRSRLEASWIPDIFKPVELWAGLTSSCKLGALHSDGGIRGRSRANAAQQAEDAIFWAHSESFVHHPLRMQRGQSAIRPKGRSLRDCACGHVASVTMRLSTSTPPLLKTYIKSNDCAMSTMSTLVLVPTSMTIIYAPPFCFRSWRQAKGNSRRRRHAGCVRKTACGVD